MKKLLRLFMLAALFLPLALNAQTSWTVADGTTTHAMVPLDFYNCDGSGNRQAQMLYPASLLTDMNGSTIGSITFYHQNTSANKTLSTSTWYIRMGETTATDLSEGLSTETLTTVYSGNLVVVNGVFSFEFTTPYTYNGGNLIVEIQTSGASGNWFGSSNQGCFGMDEIGSTYSTMSSPNYTAFLPKTTFTEVPSCFPVTNLTINATATTSSSLTFNWVDANNSGATYSVYAVTATDTTLLEENISGTTYTASDLTANTAYTYAVEANCSATDAAAKVFVSGRTACAAIAELPYTMGFEEDAIAGTTSSTAFPYCWTRINSLSSGNYYYPYSSSSSANTGNRKLYFYAYSYGTYADTTGFIMPELDINTYPMNANRVTFWAKVTSTTPYNVTVGTMSDPADMSTFTAVETVVVSETDYTKHSVSLAEANATDAYVAFIVPKVFATMYIDDVTLEELPSCLEVPSVAITETTSSTITLSWTENPGNASATYSVYNGEELVESGIDGTTYTVEDLDANTQYTFAVQANCGASGDAPLTTVSGRTACTTFEITPDNLFSEGFEGTEFPPACWSKAHTAGTSTNTWIRNTTASNVHTGSASAQLQDQQSGNKNDLVTPLLNIPEANAYQVSFWINRTTAYASKTQEGVKVWVNTTPDTIGGTPLMHIRRSTTQGDITVDAAGWYQYSAAIPTSGDVYIIFEGISEYGAATYIDDISIEEAPECLPVTNLAVSGITAHGATLTWEGDADSYVIYNMADTSEVTDVTFDGTTAILSGLNANTQYTFGVASSCGNDESSIVTKSFTTLVSCFAPTNVAVALTPGDGSVATVSWTDTLGAAWQICLNGDTTDLIDVYETSYSFDDLTPEQPYTVMVRTNCSADDEGFSTWTSVVNFTPTDAYSITVNEGTTTNGYVPIYGFYVDDITKSQFIIPASDLAAMQFGAINKLTFYASNANVSWGAAEFDVYVTETDATTVDALVDYTTMTQVYAGSLSISNNKMEVTFTNPYVYMGGNLMIGFLQTVEGSYVSCSWYGVDATGASMGGYGTSVSQRNFLPKTTINYTPGEEPDCLPVNGLAASEITTEGATLTWNGDADSYNVYVINGTDTTFEQNVSETTATLTGLTAMTSYTYGVRAVCGTNESDIRTVNFVTACAAVAIPYTESFEATSTTLGCWSVANIDANTGITTSNPYSGNNAFRFAYNTNPPQYLISPELSGTEDGLQVSFMYRIQSTMYPESFQLGYSTTTNEISAFTWGVEQTNLMNTTYEEYSEILPAGVKYVCIKYTANDMYYLYIDDVTFATPPTCLPVTNLTVDSVSETSATISWTGDAASYDVYKNGEFVANVTTTTYTFNALNAATSYTFGVQAICSATDSALMITINGITECGDVTALPYTEGFENGLGCWTTINGSSDGQPWNAQGAFSDGTITPHTGNGMAASWSWNSVSMHANAWLISPKFVLPNTTEGLTFTWWERTSSGYPDSYSVVLSTTTNDTAAFTTVVRPYGVAAGEWTQQTIDLTSYAGQNIYIAFHHVDYDENYLLIDDIELFQGGYVPPTPDTLTVTFAVNDATMGTTNPVPGTYQYITGDTVFFAAIPNAGYHFIGWEWTIGSTVADTLSAQYIDAYVPANSMMEYVNMTLTALFEVGNPDSTTITYAVNDPTMGTITPAPGTYTIYVGNSITAEATPNAGYELNAWVFDTYLSGTLYNSDTIFSTDPSFDNPKNFGTLPQSYADYDATITITALFEAAAPADSLTVHLTINNPNLGSINPAPGTYHLALNESMPITATPNEGVTFNGFRIYANGEIIGNSPAGLNPFPFTVTSMAMSLGEVTIEALFADSTSTPDSLTLILNTADATMGTTNPAPGTYHFAVGDTSFINAVPNPGYHFLYWIETVSAVGQSFSDTLIADTVYAIIGQDMASMTLSLTAYFEADSTPVVVCNTPTGLHYTAIENHAIAIAWDADANVNSWNIRYRMSGNGAWNTATANTNSYTISGLQGLTSYDIEVQANCGDGNVSEWCDAITVQTTNVGIVNHLENSVVLFPNPAREYVDIRIDGEFNVSSMEVYDVYGKLINNINVVDNPTRIYVSNLSNGMYFVRVTTDAGVVTKTFVKK